MEKYEKLLEGPVNLRIRNAHIAGVAFGYSLCVRLLYMGVVFFAGALHVSKYDLNPKSVFQAIFIMFATSLGAGAAVSQVPSASQARESAERIFAIVDEPSTLDVRNKVESSLKTVKNGQIEL
jgi:ABC-type multidrug transport system fused ATPase/permease subunit